jgi:hypothetical protein
MLARGLCATHRAGLLLLAAGPIASLAGGDGRESITGRDLLHATGVPGGPVVHLGCGTGERTLELAKWGPWVVQGLSAEPGEVEAARRTIQRGGQ